MDRQEARRLAAKAAHAVLDDNSRESAWPRHDRKGNPLSEADAALVRDALEALIAELRQRAQWLSDAEADDPLVLARSARELAHAGHLGITAANILAACARTIERLVRDLRRPDPPRPEDPA